MARSLPHNELSSLRRRCCAHLRLLLAALVVLVTMTGGCEGLGQCRVDACTRLYGDAMERNGITDPERSAAFCRVLREYGSCIRTTARSCRGNLGYHSTSSLVHHVTTEYNCSQLLAEDQKNLAGTLPEPRSSAAPPTPDAPASPVTDATLRHHHKQCVFQGRHKFRHCGLFGDPHLKTFDNVYQTCRVRGAWPLIDNPYLAVQVTNEPVVDGSPATATTKVTIIIRGRATPCTTEKTYEAQADGQPLPTLFIDGTRRSGTDENVSLTVHDDGSRVEIHLRYIETTLVVRQVGRYLALSARMPEELVATRAHGAADGLQLCVRGCPPSERLDPVAARGHALPWLAAVARCRKSDGYINGNEVSNNLTDHYLDWCVFDVMTTGDGSAADDFAAAAHSAQADALRLDPASLKNRTTTQEHPNERLKNGSAESGRRLDWRTFAAVVLVVLATLQRV